MGQLNSTPSLDVQTTTAEGHGALTSQMTSLNCVPHSILNNDIILDNILPNLALEDVVTVRQVGTKSPITRDYESISRAAYAGEPPIATMHERNCCMEAYAYP